MSLVPLVALIVFLLPFLGAHAVRHFASAAMARFVGRVFETVAWLAAVTCTGLGAWCVFSMSHSIAPWNGLGVLGMIGFVMLGSILWTAFHIAYRVLAPANRFTRFAGLPVHIEGWPSA